MKLKEVTHIAIHTSASESHGRALDASAAAIRAYHKRPVAQGGKGWSDIGYHFVIRFDGREEEGRPLNLVGAHIEGFNSQSIGICFSGHGDLQPFTPEQMHTGIDLVIRMLIHFGILDEFIKNPMRVIGHREINKLIDARVVSGVPRTTKTCPGKRVNMQEFRLAVMAEVQRRGL